jgi:protein-disulfide isomerase/uncharacterized membrane protein
LGLLGVGVSVYLTQHYYEVRNGSAGFQSLCNLSSRINCDAVAASKYAELLPGMPLSSFAAGWFLAVLIIALVARNAFWRRDSLRALLALTAVGSALSLVYLAIMATVLHTYCLFCLVTDAISFVALGLVLSLKPEGIKLHKPDLSKWKTFAGIAAAGLIVAVAGLRVLDSGEVSASQVRDEVKSVLESPVIAVNSGPEFPSIGPASAPVTIVEFSDFQCPFCRLGAFSLNAVQERYPTQVRVVFRNFPLDQACNRKVERLMHEHACEAAKTALCAFKQGKFEPVYRAFFQNQESFASGPAGTVLKLAEGAGVDPAQLQGCLGSPEVSSLVSRDIEEAINLGVGSTPTIFVNGHRIDSGVKPPVVMNRIVEAMLAQAH